MSDMMTPGDKSGGNVPSPSGASPAGDKLHYPGEVTDVQVQIAGADGQFSDITRILIELNVYENLYMPFLTGEIIVTDTTGLIDSLPIMQQEKLNISFKTWR